MLFICLFSHWSTKENRCVECLDGWKAYENVCWKFFNELENWSDAQLECRVNNSAQLMTLDNDVKFKMISDWLKSMDQVRSAVWLYSRTDLALTFNWLSNEKPIASSYWGKYEASNSTVVQEPDNGGSAANQLREACVAISKSTHSKLDDLDCATPTHFICEY